MTRLDAPYCIKIHSAFTRLVTQKKAGVARAWIDNPLPTRSTECEEGRTNSLGPLLHGRPGGRLKTSGAATRWVSHLGMGGVEPFRAAPSAAPQTQTTQTADG